MENHDEEIFVVSLDSSRPQRLTAHAGRDVTPLWTPDGARIAFASGRGESSRLQGFEYIETIEPDGRNRQRVSQRSGNYWSLTWSPAPASRP